MSLRTRLIIVDKSVERENGQLHLENVEKGRRWRETFLVSAVAVEVSRIRGVGGVVIGSGGDVRRDVDQR